MAATADLRVVETVTAGLVGAMQASTDVQRGSGARDPAESKRGCTFQMSFADECQVLITGPVH